MIPAEPVTGDRIAIELRAVELAQDPEWWDKPENENESYGALCYHNGGTPGDDDDGGCADFADAEWAGYLACFIMRGEDHAVTDDGDTYIDARQAVLP